jgi:Mg2+-importing ATPase
MLTLPIVCALIGAALPFTALHHILGFTALPLAFFLILVGMIMAYLVLVELAKTRFYAVRPAPSEKPTTRRQRFERQVVRRAAPFTRHIVSEPGRLLGQLPGVGHRA